ncbi:MAG: DNA/RNA nuclease SfsA, partial [Armatimonadota bacterium]|nr:DNA/RNA nuclease SfsA [Armatimonadota bacterium]
AKSVNLVAAGVALFPDAPTRRGARHGRALAHLARAGHLAAMVFVVQREDAVVLRPYAGVDADFAAALGEARAAGVRLRAVRCRVTPAGVLPVGAIPVDVPPAGDGGAPEGAGM